MKMLISIIAALGLAALTGARAEEEKPLSIWQYPSISLQHNHLAALMKDSLRRGDTAAFEQICRAGVRLIPGDPVWHYNLACALAWRSDKTEAFAELERAIYFGFRDAAAIENDSDLARMKSDPRFAPLVELARKTAGKPIPGRPEPASAKAVCGKRATIAAANATWDFDSSAFSVDLKLSPAPESSSSPAMQYSGPAEGLMRAWLADGSAAGNAGDIYLNRDRGHSVLDTARFPLLTPVGWERAALDRNIDGNLPNAFFPGHTVFANVSRTRLGPAARSFPRAAMTDPGAPELMAKLYLANTFFVAPAVDDYGAGRGDLFPARVPFLTASVGRSYTDLPFLEAAAAASAALPPQTKRMAVRQGLMGPILQWLMRSTLKGVDGESDYLSPKAHPAAFDASRLDAARMVVKAHSLKPAQIPPVAKIEMVNSRFFPVKTPVPGIDYPDIFGEVYYSTPVAHLVVLRDTAMVRDFLYRASVDAPPGEARRAKFAWKVVGGDASAVTIGPVKGDLFSSPETGIAQITVNRKSLVSRIDIAVFARYDNTEWGAPSFISFYPLPHELRAYREDGQISFIDYSNPLGHYSDPILAAPRPWKDVYEYNAAGRLLKYVRTVDGETKAEFLPDGRRIVAKRPDGTPSGAVKVKYILRDSGDPNLPRDLSYIDSGTPKLL